MPGFHSFNSRSSALAVIGFGDLFIAAVLGALLAPDPARQRQAAGVAALIALAFDLLFFLVSELPATRSIALALAVLEAQRQTPSAGGKPQAGPSNHAAGGKLSSDGHGIYSEPTRATASTLARSSSMPMGWPTPSPLLLPCDHLPPLGGTGGDRGLSTRSRCGLPPRMTAPPLLPGDELERGSPPLVGPVRGLEGRPRHLGRHRPAGRSAGVWVLRRRGANIPVFLERRLPALLVAQAIGRIGNYFNQELFGGPTSPALGAPHRPRELPGRLREVRVPSTPPSSTS